MAIVFSPSIQDNYWLNAWQRQMNEQIWAFNQLAGRGAPLNQTCRVYVQPDEREPIARALSDSYNKIGRILRYAPKANWFTDVIQLGAGRPSRRQYWQTKTFEDGGSWKLIEFGQRGTTVVAAASPVTYSDPNGYGVNDTATIGPIATTVTDVDEIAIFFQVTDGAPNTANERYRIQPTNVSIAGGMVTITAHRALFVKPSEWATPFKTSDPNYLERNDVDSGNASTGFISAVDVYRVYNDNSAQISVLSQNNTPINTTTLTGVIVEAESGIFTLTDQCMDWLCNICCQYPTRLQVNYYAGQPTIQGYADNELEASIVRLANVLMPVELCSFCKMTKNSWEQDRNPAVRDRMSILAANAINNKFGYVSYGSVYAYQTAVDRSIPVANKIGRHFR